MVSMTSALRCQSISSMYIRGLIPRNWLRQFRLLILVTGSFILILQIDGEAQFNVPRALLEQLTRNTEYQTFKVTANVTESITGITLEGSSDIQYHKNPYKIEFHPQMAQNFKTVFGDPYMVEVSFHLYKSRL